MPPSRLKAKTIWEIRDLGNPGLEITRFPRAKHDDQVDSLTQAITWMRQASQHAFW